MASSAGWAEVLVDGASTRPPNTYDAISAQTGRSRTGVSDICKPVKKWLAKHTDDIEVFYLPSYSPELNPDEMANADIKQAVTTTAPARTTLQLVKATSRHVFSVQKQPERARRYFEHDPVRYAA